MTTCTYPTTFDEMIALGASSSPHGLILEWWRRVERALDYYTIASYNKSFRSSSKAIKALKTDSRLDPQVPRALDGLRLVRNRVAHGPTPQVDPRDAKFYAAVALRLAATLGEAVPSELAVRSGAALVT
jgi:hypothetical protein